MFIAICDDDLDFGLNLEQLIRDSSSKDFRIKVYSSSTAFLFDYEDYRYDLILLDIEMPEASGFDVARTIRAMGDDIPIIFLTNHRDYVFDSFDYRPYHYLLKPVSIEKLLKLFSIIESNIPNRWKDYLTFFTKSGLLRIPMADITHMESIKHNVFIHTANEVYKRQATLSEILHLCDDRMIRTHQSYAVNAMKIIGTKKRYTEVIVPGATSNVHIPVSVRMYSQFVSALREFDAKYNSIPYDR